MDVDLVYLWVNDLDQTLSETRDAYARGRALTAWQNGAARVQDNGELRYSLRSVERYAPFFRRIHLVIAGAPPAWLVPDDKLVVVPQDALVPERYRPLFHSDGVESFVHGVPGLAEHYVYSNDDYFFTAPHTVSDFFDARGRASVIMTDRIIGSRSADPHAAIFTAMEQTSAAMLRRTLVTPPPTRVKRRLVVPSLAARMLGLWRVHNDAHAQQPFRRSVWEAFEKAFAPEVEALRQQRFRDATGFTLNTCYHHFAREHGTTTFTWREQCVFVPRTRLAARSELEARLATGSVRRLCLNDGVADATDGWQEFCARLLERLFPGPSRWERTSV